MPLLRNYFKSDTRVNPYKDDMYKAGLLALKCTNLKNTDNLNIKEEIK